MQPLMIMDYLGLDQLTAGFGFVTMLKAPAAFIGPPFAGSIYNLYSMDDSIPKKKCQIIKHLLVSVYRCV